MTVVVLPKGRELHLLCTRSTAPLFFHRGEGNPQGNSGEPKHPHGREKTPEVGACPLALPFFRTWKQGLQCGEVGANRRLRVLWSQSHLWSPVCFLPLRCSGPWEDHWASLKIRLTPGTEVRERAGKAGLAPVYDLATMYPGQKKSAL